MAFDEAIERGLLDRRYEFVFEENAGLPQGTAQAGIRVLRAARATPGCLAVVGANYTDSAMALADRSMTREVPVLSMCGTDAFHGEYCFRLGNGDVGGDPSLIRRLAGAQRVHSVSPCSRRGRRSPRSTSGFFRQECRRTASASLQWRPRNPLISVDELAARLQVLRDADADALVWLGYGGMVVDFTVQRALESLDWDPPRIMTTAFMQYIWGFDQLEGWVGIDQWCPDNPRMQAFHSRFVERHDDDPVRWPNAIPGLAYDMAQTIVEAIFRAPILSGPGSRPVSSGSGSCRRCTGGPNTHIAGGPFDHQMFKGDWLHYGRVRDGKLEFAGLFEPVLSSRRSRSVRLARTR